MNPGQILSWVEFLAALVAGLCFLAAMGGRAEAERPARIAYRVQWLALAASTGFLWYLLFHHQFRYEYVAT
ncbi:MAG: hypothetical protein E6K81_00950, partial [Candidatus Eisenbacteria bacterium]